MRTRRIIDEVVPDAGAGVSCGLRPVCRAWRRTPGACANCRRSPLATASGRGNEVIERDRGAIEREHAPVVVLRDEALRRIEAMKAHGEPGGAAPSEASCTVLNWRVHHELPNRTRFRLVGSRRRGAAAAVERAAEAVTGVHRARFSLETGSLLVLHDGGESTKRELRRALELVRLDEAEELRVAGSEAPRDSRNDAVRAAVLSLVSAALPPGPRAALKVVQTLSALRASRARER